MKNVEVWKAYLIGTVVEIIETSWKDKVLKNYRLEGQPWGNTSDPVSVVLKLSRSMETIYGERIQKGDKIFVEAKPLSREYNGRYYTDMLVTHMVFSDGHAEAGARDDMQEAAKKMMAIEEEESDEKLPF